jgi:hypothetical protein
MEPKSIHTVDNADPDLDVEGKEEKITREMSLACQSIPTKLPQKKRKAVPTKKAEPLRPRESED